MKKSAFLLVMIGLILPSLSKASTQENRNDEWSGDYLAILVEDGQLSTVKRQLKIVLSERYSQNQRRWHSLMDDTKTATSADNGEYSHANYRQRGWADLRIKSNLRCIGNREFALCKVNANTLIPLDGRAKYRAVTGIFSLNQHGVVNQITQRVP